MTDKISNKKQDKNHTLYTDIIFKTLNRKDKIPNKTLGVYIMSYVHSGLLIVISFLFFKLISENKNFLFRKSTVDDLRYV